MRVRAIVHSYVHACVRGYVRHAPCSVGSVVLIFVFVCLMISVVLVLSHDMGIVVAYHTFYRIVFLIVCCIALLIYSCLTIAILMHLYIHIYFIVENNDL